MEKFFELQKHGTTVQREIVAGLTTFLTMGYILAVNPGMLGKIGNGMTPAAVFTATAAASAIATIFMALLARLPVALAPGMGLNAFFTYTVVFGMGYSWQLALTAVFLEGILFIILSAFNARESIVNAIPNNLKKAVTVGIGLFITFIGFANSGIIIRGVGDVDNIIKLGSLTDTRTFLAIIGLVVIILLHSLKVPGAILIGIIGTTIISIPMGITVLSEGWKPFGLPKAPLLFQFDFSGIVSFKFFTVFFTFLFVDIFDTVGTLIGVTTQAGLADKEGNIPRVKQAFFADAVGTVAGACLGTSTVTSYVESAAGVGAGGRTGLTALTAGILFLLALLCAPVFLIIPGAAIAPALIFAGFLMMATIAEIDFKEPTEGIPAFLAIVMMPFAYSIVEGVVYGVISYVALKAVTRKFNEINVITWLLFFVFILRFFIK